MVPFFTFACFQ